MSAIDRRYDIDWLRVIAIGLLLVYHASITVQSWGFFLGFITNSTPWDSLWFPMAMLNVWRIPLLFFISGMGVYFAIQNKNWKQLLQERAKRILVPFIFGILLIVPIQVFISRWYYHQGESYSPDPAHLWFLGNIFIYVLLLLPLFLYLKRNERFIARLRAVLGSPFCLLIVVACFIIEALILDPAVYALYAMTGHGFFLGLLAFFFGFCFILGGAPFWKMLLRWRWLFLTIAVALYVYRLLQVQMRVPNIQLVIESNAWIFSILAFGHRYLNHPGPALRYLSQAAYPVYIIHMICLNLTSALIFPLDMDVRLKFALILLFTIALCFIVYEFAIRRASFVRVFFGLKA